jgi:hypothetical protein
MVRLEGGHLTAWQPECDDLGLGKRQLLLEPAFRELCRAAELGAFQVQCPDDPGAHQPQRPRPERLPVRLGEHFGKQLGRHVSALEVERDAGLSRLAQPVLDLPRHRPS